MYTFPDKAGRSLTLRPESTAAVCRAYVERGMQHPPRPVRLFYIGPQFRYERPQKGRYRQFHQIGAEFLGGPKGTASDVEVLLLLVAFLRQLGFQELTVLLNTVGDAESRAAYRERLVEYLRPLVEKLSEESRKRLETNPLRILDTKSPEERELLVDAPRLEDCLTATSREHFRFIQNALDGFGIAYRIEPRLVRGLDYYTNTVFEIVAAGLGAQDAICGGGAYEGLVEELGGKPTYGVGFAIGEDRLIDVLPRSFRDHAGAGTPVIEVVPLLGESREAMIADYGIYQMAMEIAEKYRQQGMAAVSNHWRRSPTDAIKRAVEGGSRFLVLIGEEEMSSGRITIRDLEARDQAQASFEETVAWLRRAQTRTARTPEP
jgi:histidyl-tRNA synthetase